MMKNKNLLNLVERNSYEQTRKGRYTLDSIVSRFCVVSLIYANKLLNHRTTPLGRFVLPEHLPFSKPKVNWLLHVSLICLCMLTVGVGNVWGDSYTITFNGSVNESTLVSGTAASITGNSTYVTGNVSSVTKAYGPTSNGVKVGVSGSAGSFTISLSASGQVTPTSIVVNCKLYNSSKAATVNVNGIGAQSVSSSFSNVTFTTSTALTSLTIASSKYIWVKSITVNYTGAVTYSVTYNANGASSGTVPTDGTSYSSGATVTVKGNTGSLVKTGYAFGGWNTQADGNGTDRAVGSTFSISANTNLYAKWTANTISLTLNKNNSDASGSANGSASVKYDATSLTSISHATRTGHSIEGYYAEAGCTNKVLTNAGALVNYSGYVTSSKWARTTTPTTLYAKWNVNSYLLTWNLNGGTVTEAGTGAAVDATGSPSSSVSYGASITAPTVEKEGYTFTGWNTTPASTMPAAATTYTAQWSINQYTVTWKSNGSTARTDNNVNHGTAQTPPTISPLPCGEKLAGWTDAEDGAYVHGTSTLYTTATITITSNKTFYAVFADYDE